MASSCISALTGVDMKASMFGDLAYLANALVLLSANSRQVLCDLHFSPAFKVSLCVLIEIWE